MAEPAQSPTAGDSQDEVERLVLRLVSDLASELGGARARHAVWPKASLERDIGLGSLERVELLLRIESAFGRRLDDSALALDTPAELASAIATERFSSQAPGSVLPAPSVGAARALVAPPVTLQEVLFRRAELEGDRVHALVLEEDHKEQVVTYARLWSAASTVGGGLRAQGVRKGDTVAIMLPTGFDFLRAFLGVLVSGAVPVPIYPPARLDRLQEYAQRQSAILADAGVKVLITVDRAKPVAHLLKRSVKTLVAVTTCDELSGLGASWPALEASGSDAAFIQYTSGSTGHPKGVLLSHDNLLANIRAIGRGIQVVPTDVAVSWLPLYHDMGLIGSWLFCLVEGLPISILSPLAFLSHPDRWLWTIHARRATLSAAPNFAYEMCARRIPESAMEGLDLSSWRCALNGAEPVRPETLERFARRFAPSGFRPEALMPVYGLAENSVALCFPPVGRAPKIDRVAREPFEREGVASPAGEGEDSLLFVGVGQALPGHEVRLLADSGEEAPERRVARLVFRGPSMTQGYFGKPEETAAITLPGGWLDSGDLAYRAGGEIFVTGRRKDLIIKAGRNLVPQEIEEIASGAEGVRRGCVVAFGVLDPSLATERLVVVAESRRQEERAKERIAEAITDLVASAIGVPPDDVVVAPPGAVPKTSSGKIRRGATRDLYRAGRIGASGATTLRQRISLVRGYLATLIGPWPRKASRVIYAGYLGTVLAILGLALWPLALLLPEGRALRIASRWAARLGLFLARCSLSIEGREHLTGGIPSLLVSNHQSYIDALVLLALLPREFAFVAKREVLRWPLVGTFVRRAHHLTVDRSSAKDGVSTASNVARALESGEWVLIFPEATFTSASGLRPFRLGAFKTAVDTDSPIVPVALRGARDVLRDGTWIPRPGRIHAWIGPPMKAAGTSWRDAVDLRDRVAAEVAGHCGEPVLDLVAAGPVSRV